MPYKLPESNLIEVAINLGWTPESYWRTEVAWKKWIREHPIEAAVKYLELMRDVQTEHIKRLMDEKPDELSECYIDEAFSHISIDDRGELFKEMLEQQAEAYIWEYKKGILQESMHAMIARYIAESAEQSWHDSPEVPKDNPELIKDFAAFLTAQMDEVQASSTYILVDANKRGINVNDATIAYTIDDALRAFEYAPSSLEDHWAYMIEEGIVSEETPFDAESTVLHARALKRIRNFYGLTDGIDASDAGNFIDGDSNSAYVLIVITPEGIVNHYPK